MNFMTLLYNASHGLPLLFKHEAKVVVKKRKSRKQREAEASAPPWNPRQEQIDSLRRQMQILRLSMDNYSNRTLEGKRMRQKIARMIKRIDEHEIPDLEDGFLPDTPQKHHVTMKRR